MRLCLLTLNGLAGWGKWYGLGRRHSPRAARSDCAQERRQFLHAAGYYRRGRYTTSASHWRKSLMHTHHGPFGDCCPRAGKMGTAHCARLAIRPLHWLFRNDIVFLFRVAPAVPGRGSLHGGCRPAVSASLHYFIAKRDGHPLQLRVGKTPSPSVIANT